MGQSELKLRVLFDTIDRVTKPLKTMLQGNRQLAQSFKATHDKLKALNQAQKELAAFRALREGMRQTADALKTAQQRLQALSERIKASDAPTAAMTRKFSQASLAVTQLSQHYQTQGAQLKALQGRLTATRIQTGRLGSSEKQLRSEITATNAALSAQQTKLASVAAQEKRLSLARERMHRLQSRATHLSVAGYASRATGLHALTKIDHTLGEAKATQSEQQRIRALGLGEATSKEAIRFAQNTKTIGISQNEKLTLMRDAMSVFGDLHHAKLVLPTLAKMKFANDALYGGQDAAANEQRFINMLKVIELRGGLASESRFKAEAERIQKVFTITSGRVGPEQWQAFIQRGGVAAKQLRNDAFYYQMEPLLQQMSGDAVGTGLMSAYSNIYQGKTTFKAARELQRLGLIDPKKVELNKIGMLKEFKPGALKGSALFKQSPLEWLEHVLLPALAQKGITQEDQIKDTIATIFSNPRASNLFTTLYMQRGQIHKNARNSAGAAGIDTLHNSAQQTARGSEIQFLAEFHDLKRALGQQVLPLYTRALEVAMQATQRLTAWIEKHPKATKFLMVTLMGLGTVLVGFGTLTIALAAIIGPLAIVKFSFATLGIKAGLISGVLSKIGRAFLWLRTVVIAHPVIALITALAFGALYVWRHWDAIGPKLADCWAKLKERVSEIGEALKAKWQTWINHLTQLKDKWVEVGVQWMQGLLTGIKQTLVGIINQLTGWLKIPIEAVSHVLPKFNTLATSAGPIHLTELSTRPLIDTRRPMTPPQASQLHTGGDTVNIMIQGMPGMDATAIAQTVRRELDKRERDKRARFASRLID